MTRLEVNELLVGVGIAGIAAYLLWPHPAALPDPSPQGQDHAIAQLGGIAMPGLPSYLTDNRPAFAIQPAGYMPTGNPAILGWADGAAYAAGLPRAPASNGLPLGCGCG